jgi:soluble lytic murein transglycosylase-like protein
MTRLLLILASALLLLLHSADAEARPKGPRANPGRRAPKPGVTAPCRSGGCSLDGLVTDVQTASDGVSSAESTTSGSDGGGVAKSAGSLSEFPNSDAYDNVKAMLEFVSEEYGLPLQLVYATAWTESRWTQWSGGSVLVGGGADYGLMQLNKSTWSSTYDWSSISDDVRENIQAGAEVLKWSYDYAKSKGYTGSQLDQAAYAVYNGGPSAVSRPFTSSHQNDTNFLDNYQSKYWENNS